MPNKRTFNVQGLATNGVLVAGTSQLRFDPSFENILESPADGWPGSEYVDRTGLRCLVTLTTSDVVKGTALLASTPASTSFSTKESGLSTWHNYVLNTNGKIIWTNIQSIRLRKDGYSEMVVAGEVIFQTNVSNWRDVLVLTAASATPPTNYIPGRLFKPYNVAFDPDGATPSFSLLHVQSLDVVIPQPVIRDFGDSDIGHTAVDVIAPQPVQVSVSFRDVTASGGSHIAADVLSGARGVLVAELLSAGGAASKFLTVNNLLWVGAPQDESVGYTLITLNGRAGWRKDDGTMYALNTGIASARLFSIL